METLLMVAIVIIALGIVVQAGVLVAMYLAAKEVKANVDGLVAESKRMLAPVEHITQNVQAASEDLAIVGKVARDEMNHVSVMVEEGHIAMTQITARVKGAVSETVDEIQYRVVDPFRRWSALASGVRTGFRVFFKGIFDRDISETPAA